MTQDHGSSTGSCWERSFELSYRLACERLARIGDIREHCGKSGAQYIGPGDVAVNYMNQRYHIMIAECKVLLEGNDTETPLRDRILILHYFVGAKGTPATDKLIAYKQLPGGVSYFSAFSQRVIRPLVKNFGITPELLGKTARKLGGREADHGDISVTINAFDRVPITLVLWKGDEEVAPNGNVLFNANVSDYLSTEDVTVLSETLVWKLVRSIPSA
jgi:hypothetical protein